MGLFGLMLGGAVAGKVAGNTAYKKQRRQAQADENLEMIAGFFVDMQDKKERARTIAELNGRLTKLGLEPLTKKADDEAIYAAKRRIALRARIDAANQRLVELGGKLLSDDADEATVDDAEYYIDVKTWEKSDYNPYR